MTLVAGIEAGGSKLKVAVGPATDQLLLSQKVEFATGNPDATLAQVLDFLAGCQPLTSIGVAAFGPVQTDPQAANYGEILDTPKLDWQGVNWLDALAPLEIPVRVDTDVNCAALAEARQSLCASLAYITVGTGIGVGFAGLEFDGPGHAEMGHMFVQRHPRDSFGGVCPFHGDCLEGLASGPALAARWGCPAEALHDELAWEMEASYLAQACVNLLRVLPLQRLVLGGGVLGHDGLLEAVRAQVQRLCAGYGEFALPFSRRIQAPTLGADSGITGAVLLAVQAASIPV